MVQSYYATTPREVLLAPQPGDVSPASGLGRVIMRVIVLEVDKLCTQFELTLCDEIDEERYERAMAPYLALVAREFRPGNVRPREAELRLIRSGIRELERWRRKPTEAELREVVDKALGIERVEVTGADAAARRVVSAQVPKGLPSAPKSDDLSWVQHFPRSGSVERDMVILRAIKNVGDPGARYRACIAVAAGYQRVKAEYRASIMKSLRSIPEGQRLSYYLKASRKLRARRDSCGHLFWRVGVATLAVQIWQTDHRAELDQQFAKLLGYGGK